MSIADVRTDQDLEITSTLTIMTCRVEKTSKFHPKKLRFICIYKLKSKIFHNIYTQL